VLIAFAIQQHAARGLQSPARVVVYGQGDELVQLLVAKQAARRGFDAFVQAPDARTARRGQSLMYGKSAATAGADGTAEDGADPPRARCVFGADALGDALAEAEGLVLVCGDREIADAQLNALMRNTPALKRVALLR